MATNRKPAKPTKVYSVRLDVDLRRRAKVYGAEKDISFKDVLNQALEEFLKRRGR